LVDAASIESRLERLRALIAELDEIREGGRDAYAADPRLRLAPSGRCSWPSSHVSTSPAISSPNSS
jgi:hypothetical protein